MRWHWSLHQRLGRNTENSNRDELFDLGHASDRPRIKIWQFRVKAPGKPLDIFADRLLQWRWPNAALLLDVTVLVE